MKVYYGLNESDYKELFAGEFQAFFDNLMIDEGGKVTGDQARKINDSGGATKFGISLRFLQGLGIEAGDINHDGVIDEQRRVGEQVGKSGLEHKSQ